MDLHLFANETLLGAMTLGALLNVLYTIFKVAVGLGLVIFVHELGHFLVAKACGVQCDKFYVGFDVPIKIGPFNLPRTLWKKQWGETEYGIGIIPLGGYVKMLGQDDNVANAEAESERTRVHKTDAEGNPTDEYELDPRSYPAKSVPQRMAIISAGVIMNVIFAVVFATIAFAMGVSYMPTVISRTTAGDPAWVAGLTPGERIVQIGEDDVPREYTRFDKDLMAKVFFNGSERALTFVVREDDGDLKKVAITPTSKNADKRDGRPVIGISPPLENKLDTERPVLSGFPAARTDVDFEGGDVIVAIDDQPVDGYDEVVAALASRPGESLTFTVKRAAADDEEESVTIDSAKTANIEVAPTPFRTLGIAMEMGPIVAIQEGSVAEKAGFEVGDVLLTMDGEPIGDPVTLPERLLSKVGAEVAFEVRRNKEKISLSVTPRSPLMYHPLLVSDSPVALETLGLAYETENTISSIAAGSPAAKAGLQKGDQIVRAVFVPPANVPEDEEEAKLMRQQFQGIYAEPEPSFASTVSQWLTGQDLPPRYEISEEQSNWPVVVNRLQWPLPEVQVKLSYKRDGEVQQTEALSTVESERWHFEDRGLVLTTLSDTFEAGSAYEAAAYGLRETKEQLLHVCQVLWKLITGQLSPTNLGGPVTIAVVAGHEASQGIPELLIFLTFLSANLAVVNFLPIPVLDGGHMMFLLWEGITGKPASEQFVYKLTLGGLFFLLGLMVFVFSMDILRLPQFFQ